MRVEIHLQGCDDHTTVEVEATEDQIQFLQTIADATAAKSQSDCEPVMSVTRMISEAQREANRRDIERNNPHWSENLDA